MKKGNVYVKGEITPHCLRHGIAEHLIDLGMTWWMAPVHQHGLSNLYSPISRSQCNETKNTRQERQSSCGGSFNHSRLTDYAKRGRGNRDNISRRI